MSKKRIKFRKKTKTSNNIQKKERKFGEKPLRESTEEFEATSSLGFLVSCFLGSEERRFAVCATRGVNNGFLGLKDGGTLLIGFADPNN
jgi:hypothetical protein